MTGITYRAAASSPAIKITDKQATRIGKEIARLHGRRGNPQMIPTEKIVEAAKNPRSAMHEIIWSKTDRELAYEARLHLARQLICSIEIVSGGGEAVPLAVSVMISNGPHRGYLPTDAVTSDRYLSEQMDKRARERLQQWLEEFRAFRRSAGLAQLWQDVETCLKTPHGKAASRSAKPRAA